MMISAGELWIADIPYTSQAASKKTVWNNSFWCIGSASFQLTMHNV